MTTLNGTCLDNYLMYRMIEQYSTHPLLKTCIFFQVWQNRFLYLGVLFGNLSYVGQLRPVNAYLSQISLEDHDENILSTKCLLTYYRQNYNNEVKHIPRMHEIS